MVGLDKNQTYTDNLDFFANMVNAKATQVACAYKDDGKEVHYSCIFNVCIPFEYWAKLSQCFTTSKKRRWEKLL
ncbi:unnamed protein product [Cylicostephanus goldi]|uniref:SCP domain-containing protein n=1 Tax=Cylicostephanus goldi TaxID=71465 RepID=A0A3P7N8D2_CYLGO|nr:unnamed protein product [Cylicostephanus goldi]